MRPTDHYLVAVRSLFVCCLVIWSVALCVGAQEPTPPAAPTPTQDTRSFDFVAAMVGNRAILASQVTERWREALKDDAQRPRALQQFVSPAKRHALWGHLLEVLVTNEITAQSARLMGRSPDEVEAQVQRLVQEDIGRQAEESGGLNEFARSLGAVGQSMGSIAEESRAKIMSQMAYYQGVLRELHDQQAMLATPKEMKAAFDADPSRFESLGSVKLAVQRFPRAPDRDAALSQATAVATAWRALARPVTAPVLKSQGADTHIIDVTLGQEGTTALKIFAPTCLAGDSSDPIEDEGWVWVLLCLERVEAKRADFSDAEVQSKLRKEIASRHWQQIASRLFPENRVGVRRLPWGEPSNMERPARPGTTRGGEPPR